MRIKKSLIGLFFCFIFSIFFLNFRTSVLAQNKVDITAKVPSQVSAENSTVYLSSNQTMADPINHPILLVVNLRDKNGNPLPKKEVKVTSSRGLIDVIESTRKLSLDDNSEINQDSTDEDGRASFRITSFYSGKVDLNILADGVVPLKASSIDFLPRPLASYFSLSINLPFSGKSLTILPTSLDNFQLTESQKESVKIANPETKIVVPFGIFVLLLIIIFGVPIIILINSFSLRRIKKMEKQEIEILKIMAKNDTLLQDYLKNQKSSQ